MLKKKVLLNLIPIFFHLFCLPLWFIGDGWIGGNGNLSLFELIVNIIIIPIYLVIVNIKLFKLNLKNIVICYFFMSFIVITGAYMDFFNWWISGGRYGLIDSMTIDITEANAFLSWFFVSVLWIAANIIRFIRYKRRKSA